MKSQHLNKSSMLAGIKAKPGTVKNMLINTLEQVKYSVNEQVFGTKKISGIRGYYRAKVNGGPVNAYFQRFGNNAARIIEHLYDDYPEVFRSYSDVPGVNVNMIAAPAKPAATSAPVQPVKTGGSKIGLALLGLAGVGTAWYFMRDDKKKKTKSST